jgi:hypothetical protein
MSFGPVLSYIPIAPSVQLLYINLKILYSHSINIKILVINTTL